MPEVATPFGLDLAGTRVTDAQLKRLAGMKNLTWLYAFEGRGTDAGVKHLARATALTDLNRRGTAVSDAGMGRSPG